MPLTPEHPEPWILQTKASSTLQLNGCNRAREAIIAYLYMGEDIGEDDLFVTVDMVYPVVEAWVDSVNALQELFVGALNVGDLAEEDIEYQRMLFLKERADFYLEVLDSVDGSELWYQRQEIYTYILRPLLFGQHFEQYFDSETEVIMGPLDYCLPQLLANHLGYSVNYYRSFAHFVRWWHSDEMHQAVHQYWDDLPSEIAEKYLGPWEIYQRWTEEHAKPVLRNLKEIGSVAKDVAVETGKTLARVVKNPFGTAVALGAIIYFLGGGPRRK